VGLAQRQRSHYRPTLLWWPDWQNQLNRGRRLAVIAGLLIVIVSQQRRARFCGSPFVPEKELAGDAQPHRPQFRLRLLFLLTALVAVGCWGWPQRSFFTLMSLIAMGYMLGQWIVQKASTRSRPANIGPTADWAESGDPPRTH
jgi:hypothetical protein